jgi:Homeodomain-like domain
MVLAERELLMKRHQQAKSLAELSRETGIARPVLSRWRMRYQRQGRVGLEPRSRRPSHSPGRLAQGICTQIWELPERGSGPARIALTLGISHSSVHRLLLRQGGNRLLSFDGLTPVERRQAYSQQAQL